MNATDQSKGAVQVQPVSVYRLSQQQYDELERKVLSRVLVTDTTSAVQAGYFVGLQDALKIVRTGFTQA